MASTGAPTTADYQALKRTVQLQTIQKAILQSICSVNGLPKTGNKNELQKRILNRKRQLNCNPNNKPNS